MHTYKKGKANLQVACKCTAVFILNLNLKNSEICFADPEPNVNDWYQFFSSLLESIFGVKM